MLKTNTILLIIVISSVVLTAVSGVVGGFPLRFLEPVFCIQIVGAVCPPFAISWFSLVVDFAFWTVVATIGFAGLRVILGAKDKKAEARQNSENEKEPSQIQPLPKRASLLKLLTASKSKLLIIRIAVIILLVLAVGLAGYLVYRNYQPGKEVPKTQPTPTLSLPSEPISPIKTGPGSTAGWETYFDENGFFSIKYPNEWEEPEVFLQSTATEYTFPSSSLHIRVGVRYNQDLGRELMYLEIVAEYEKSAVGSEEIVISGIPTKKYIHKTGASTLEEVVILQKAGDRNIYWITMSFPPGSDTEIFDQILSTFKFLDQEQTDETADWKIYRNEEYGFTFEHPNFDYLCCNISGPLSEKAERVIVLADKSTTVGGTDKPFNGLAVYVEPNTDGKSFQKYMEEQKEALLENYYYAMGGEVEPNSIESSILVNGQKGIVLSDYAWWADMIYTPFPNSSKILIIAKTEESEGSFGVIFNKILSTFRFID